MTEIRLTIYGPPRSKKTHNQVATVGGRTIVLPSKYWRLWVKDAKIVGYGERTGQPFLWPPTGRPLPDLPYNCTALFFREKNAGDAVGLYQGLADLLETREVLTNDKWLVSWDGSRLRKDALKPRVEITLTPVEYARGDDIQSDLRDALLGEGPEG